jgi:hypothetical protein
MPLKVTEGCIDGQIELAEDKALRLPLVIRLGDCCLHNHKGTADDL